MDNAFAYSPNSKGAWAPSARNPSGSPKAWRWGTLEIKTGRTNAGFLRFTVLFPNGKHCHQATLADAMDYAEAHCAANT